jgi:hypothetical protein
MDKNNESSGRISFVNGAEASQNVGPCQDSCPSEGRSHRGLGGLPFWTCTVCYRGSKLLLFLLRAVTSLPK